MHILNDNPLIIIALSLMGMGLVIIFAFTNMSLTVFIILAMIILGASLLIVRRIFADDSDVADTNELLEDYELRLLNLMLDKNNVDYSKELIDLYETVKYADRIGGVSEDLRIDSTLLQLEKALANRNENSATTDINDAINNLNASFARRKEDISKNISKTKRGKIQ